MRHDILQSVDTLYFRGDISKVSKVYATLNELYDLRYIRLQARTKTYASVDYRRACEMIKRISCNTLLCFSHSQRRGIPSRVCVNTYTRKLN